ncbi:MAG: fibronectin type III domain-containing protein [Candidatus Kapabacteria bacterium]|nr:fibronectin type III domain-containing protein [Candidatus Kapabacteria bacterium]
MKSIWRNLSILSIAFAVIAMVGCDSVTEPTDTTPAVPKAPASLEAKSVNQTSIGLRWTLAANDTVTPTGFVVEYGTKESTTRISLPVSGASTRTATVTGLTEGAIYEFAVYAMNDTVRSLASPKVQWASARRAEGTFKLYSSSSSSEGSGLGIFRAAGMPAVLKIANGGEWDLCFDDKEAGNPKIGSPGQSRYVDAEYKFPNGQLSKTVYINDVVYTNVTSLDDVYESSPLTLPAVNGERMFPINGLPASTSGIAFVMGTRDETDKKYNFAKVLLKKQSNGSYIMGSGASAYVEVVVSYQTVKDVPYAVKAKFDELDRLRHSAPAGPMAK